MDFLELAKKRYSVKCYDGKRVEPEKLAIILEAARVSPTARNNQPFKILVVSTPEGFYKLQKGYMNTFDAPLALIVCVNRSQSWKRGYDNRDSAELDASVVVTHMMLAATDLGLGTLWLYAYDPETIREEFNIPAELEPMSILLAGYALDVPASPDRHSKTRKKLDDIVVYGSF